MIHPNLDQVKGRYDFLLRDGSILVAIWAVCAIADWTWLSLDQTEPAWDQGAHLTTAMQYWRLFQQPELGSGEWWANLWGQSPTYRGPWVYLLTVPFLQGLGTTSDGAVWVNQLFSAFLLISVYGIGYRLFDRPTALWSAAFCALSPTLAFVRVDYLLDYGLTATLVSVFAGLTFWWTASRSWQTWLWSMGTGFGLGCAILGKPTNVLFLLLPLGWLIYHFIRRRQWYRWAELGLMLAIATLIVAPWVQQNWLTLITSMINSNAVGQGEGDPSATTLAGWWYYIQRLPDLVSWPIFLLALLGGGWVCLRAWKHRTFRLSALQPAETWLLSYVLGFYGLCSLATNKDLRFILPITPILIVLMVRLALQLPRPWGQFSRWGGVAIATILLGMALFPSPGSAKLASQHLAQSRPLYPVQEAVQTVYKTNPYQISTLGMLVDTPQIHAFNVDFYGTQRNFQVLGRQLGRSKNFIDQDALALDWYLTKTGHQGSWVDHPVITPIREQVEADQANLEVFRTWPLPDRSELRLYHRRQPAVSVSVIPYSAPESASSDSNRSDSKSERAIAPAIQITQITAPAQTSPGTLIPTRFQIQGSWESLQTGTLILSWQSSQGQTLWVQDHAIGLNQLPPQPPNLPRPARIEVIENLMTLPPADLPLGTYTLQATYLDRSTETATPLAIPSTQIQLTATPPNQPTGLPDRVSQLRHLAQYLAQGRLDAVFDQVGSMNQYGPVEAYLQTADSAARYRLQQNPQDLASAYTLVLANVLRRQPDAVITGLQQVTQLDAKNPYAWAYLAFVHLYNWQPQAADQALAKASILQPDLPELKTLRLVSAIMQAKIPQVFRLLSDTPASGN